MKYIAFLRGINVSGQKKILMADLKLALQDAGFENIITYIQSGNLVFESKHTDTISIQNTIQKVIFDKFQFQVPTIVLTKAELQTIINQNSFLTIQDFNEKRMYFTLLFEKPKADLIEKLLVSNEYKIVDNVIYMHLNESYGDTKLNNNYFEKVLKTKATTRNLNTMLKMLELAK